MRINDNLSGDVVTIELGGKIMCSDGLTSFGGKVQYYLNLNKKSFIIDLEQVDWMNSAGLGALISAYKSVHQVGGRFVLANITNIQNLLNITQLVRVFESFDSQTEAFKAVTSHH
jgi:anti-anti-sigma factor